MHGPFQFIGNGFIMWIFGDGEYQARILAATMGTAMVIMPFLLRKQLGTYRRARRGGVHLLLADAALLQPLHARGHLHRVLDARHRHLHVALHGDAEEQVPLPDWPASWPALFLHEGDDVHDGRRVHLLLRLHVVAMHVAEQDPREVAGHAAMCSTSLLSFALMLTALDPRHRLAVLRELAREIRPRRAAARGEPAHRHGVARPAACTPRRPELRHSASATTWRNRAEEGRNHHIADAEFDRGDDLDLRPHRHRRRDRPALEAEDLGDRRRRASGCPYFLLSTTFFTNMDGRLKPDGFFSVIWGSLDYWISQQDVRRGNQPDYYYFITIPVYEFLPLDPLARGGGCTT